MRWEIKAQADQSDADIYINDFIGDWIDNYWGFGVTSQAFIDALQKLPESVRTIRVHVNSPGGDVVAASHIANTLRDQQFHKGRTVEMLIEGAAWSAATIITSAGNPTKIADNAIVMIHDPWTVVVGNSRDLRKAAEINDKFRDTIVSAYRWKSPLSQDALVEMMAADTWMDADDAIANGFADEKIEGMKIAAAFDPERLPKQLIIPEKFRDRVQALLQPTAETAETPDPAAQPEAPGPAPEEVPPTPTAPPEPEPAPEPSVEDRVAAAEKRAQDILSLCTKAGVPAAAAEFLSRGLSAGEVQSKLADADKIRARCAAAKLPDRADRYIAAGMSVKEVADDLFDVLIARQGPEIDNKLTPEASQHVAPAKPLDVHAINARYQQKESLYRRKS